MDFSQEIIDHFIEFEGKIDHFYLDGPGNVTIGIGCVIFNSDDTDKFNMFHRSTNKIATTSEKLDEYALIKRAAKNAKPSYYKDITRLYLPDSEIIKLFKVRLTEFYEQTKQICFLGAFPEKAQLVLLDMVFNLGVMGVKKGFPKFTHAFQNRDWKTAAAESHRNGIQIFRNEWTKETLLSLVEVS